MLLLRYFIIAGMMLIPFAASAFNAEVKMFDGAPRLVIDGQIDTGFSYATNFPPRQGEMAGFTAAGTRIFQFYHNLDKYWTGPGQYDFSSLDQGYEELARQYPQIMFSPRIILNAPAWWINRNPSEVAISMVGRIVSTQSFASEKWRQDAGEALRQLVCHINKSSYNKHVIGYFLCAGEEWSYFGAWWNDHTPYDASTLTVTAFRQWLEHRYQTPENLQKAWYRENVNFSTAAVPSKTESYRDSGHLFRNPATAVAVIDYERFASELIVDNIIHFAKIIKKETGGKAVVGAFFGYVIGPSMHYNDYSEQLQGHLALDKLLKASDVDIISTPANYRYRGSGEGWFSQTVMQSVLLHGKLFMSEDDFRTSIAGDACGRSETYEADEAQLERIMAWRVANGISGWLANLGSPPWFDMPILSAEIKRTQTIGERLNRSAEKPAAEIAVFVDPSAYSYFSPIRPDLRNKIGNAYGAKRDKADFTGPAGLIFFSRAVSRLLNEEMAQLGAPFHAYLLDDLDHPALPDYKLYIMVSPVYLQEKQRLVIEQRLKSKGHTVLWLFAPGIAEEGKLTAAGISNTTGIEVEFSRKSVVDVVKDASSFNMAPVVCRILPGPHPIVRGLEREVFFREENFIAPIIAVKDPNAVKLGETTLDLYPFSHETSLAVKEFPNWKSIYSFAPVLPAKLLRNIAHYAGVHIYSESGDYVTAGRGIVSIHCSGDGERIIRLPQPTAVYALSSGTLVGNAIDNFKIDGKAGRTFTFMTGQSALTISNNSFPAPVTGAGKIALLPDGQQSITGWNTEKITAVPLPPPADGYRLTAQPGVAALLLQFPVKWQEYPVIELKLKASATWKGNLLFRIIEESGRTWRWDLTTSLTPGKEQSIYLSVDKTIPPSKAGLYFLSADGQTSPELELSAVNILTSAHPVTDRKLKPELVVLPDLRNWLCLAPFDDSGLKGINLPLPPDREINTEAVYPGKNGTAISWQRITLEPGSYLEFQPLVNNAVGYAMTHIYAPVAMPILLLAGSDDGLAVWHDGKLIWSNPAWRGVLPESDIIRVTLKQGWNQLLFKVNQGSGGWGLSVQLATPMLTAPPELRQAAALPGMKLPDTKVRLEINQQPKGTIMNTNLKKWATAPLLALVPHLLNAADPAAVTRYDFDTPVNFVNQIGNWKIDNGKMVQSNGSLNVSARTFVPTEFKNFTVDIRFRITGGEQKQFSLFFLNAKPDKPDETTCQVSIAPGSSNTLNLSKRQNGQWTELGKGDFTCNINDWYTLRVSKEGAKIKIAVNGNPLLECEDAESLNSSGKIGFGFYGGTGEIDDIAIINLDPKS